MMSLRDRFDRGKRKKSTRTQRIGVAFFWLLVLSFAYFIPAGKSWEAESHLYLTFAMVDHHSLNIDPYHAGLGDMSYWHGHHYSDKAPGMSFLAVPPYAVFRAAFPAAVGVHYKRTRHGAYAIPLKTVYIRYAMDYLLLIFPSAIFGVLLWLFLSRVTGDQRWALFLTSVYSLGTIAWVYTVQFLSHQIAAILFFGSFLLLYHQVARRAGGRRVYLFGALAGLLAGYAVITEYPTVVIAAALGGYLLLVARRRLATCAAFIAGMIPPAALAMAYDTAAFGKPFALGYAHVQSAAYHNSIRTGFLGIANPAKYGVQPPSLSSIWQITFGTYRGIFLVSPVLLLFFAGLIFMWKRRDLRPEFWLCVAVVLLYFLLDASRGKGLNGWSGGYSVASRHLTPMLPFMILPMAFGLGNRVFRWVLAALGALSIAIMFMIVATGASFVFSDQNPLVHEVLRPFLRGTIQISWGSFLGLRHFASLLPFMLIAAALLARLIWLFRSRQKAASPLLRPHLLSEEIPRAY